MGTVWARRGHDLKGDSSEGFGGLVLLVLVLGTIARFWVWIVGAIAIAVLGVLLWKFAGRIDRRLEAWEARRARVPDELAAIARRADEQNAQVLPGDERGVYGEYEPFQGEPGKDW